MTERTFRPMDVAAATLVIAGVLAFLFPQHGMNIARLVLVTFAAVAGLHSVAVIAPEDSVTGRWTSPFDRTAPAGSEPPRSGETDRIRSQLAGRRQRIRDGRRLPPAVVRLLHDLITVALRRSGLDPDDEAQRAAIRGRLTPLTWAVLTSDPLSPPRWYRMRWPDRRRTADLVHRVLDDLDQLAPGHAEIPPDTDARHPRGS